MGFLHQTAPMKRSALLLVCLLHVTEAHGKGHASVDWVPEKAEATEGTPIRTVIRMNIDKGWHTYWKNPGDVGIPVTLKPDLPEGWKTGEIQYPVPHKITASELTSFCFEGEVLLPVTLTPPPGFSGKLPALRATVSWLACDEQACVPGKQVISLAADPDPGMISKAYDALPGTVNGAKLSIEENGDTLKIGLKLPADWKTDISGYSVFPITSNLLAHDADLKFARTDAKSPDWSVSAPKNEYLDEIPESFSILLSDGSGASWIISSVAVPAPQPDR